jgi:hypothetical protein
MLSDTLEQAVRDIDRYVAAFPECYGETSFAARLKQLRDAMDNLRNEIDVNAISGREDMARTAGKDFKPRP